MAAASINQRGSHVTTPGSLLSSGKLSSKYVSSNRELLGSVSLLKTQESTSSRAPLALTRNISQKAEALGSSSTSSLTSAGSLKSATASKVVLSSSLLKSDLTSGRKNLVGVNTRSSLSVKSSYPGKAAFEAKQLETKPWLTSKPSLSLKSELPLTTFSTVPTTVSKTASGTSRGLGGSHDLTNTTLHKPTSALVQSASFKTTNLLLTTTKPFDSSSKNTRSLRTTDNRTAIKPPPTKSMDNHTLIKPPLTTGYSTKSSLTSQLVKKKLDLMPTSLSSKPVSLLSNKGTVSKSQLGTLHGKSLGILSNQTRSEGLLDSSKAAAAKKQPEKSEPDETDVATARPITGDTEGAPKYDFSSSTQPKPASKKQLFVSPELDASVQTPPTPAVDVVGLKTTLVNAVATSLLCSPDFHDPRDPTHKSLTSLGEKLARYDPEFVLKLSIYTRLSLNIRTTANFLLALAAKLPACRPYLRKYFTATVKLPSDWIEVAEIYQAFQDKNIKSGAIPTALRKVMDSKFKEFDAYQLAKYNKDSSKKTKKTSKEDREKKKAEKVEEEKKEVYLANFPPLKMNAEEEDSDSDDEDSSVVLSESENKEEIERMSFTLKQLIRKIHISEPVEYIMCLVGKKYPEDSESFRKSRLPGTWDQDRAGKRMKLPTPETWETQVSSKGNKASTWQDLIDHNKLPFMAMLRNIRNLILAGVSAKHHQWVIKKLNDERAVLNSKQFPFRFFSAYEVLGGLEKMADGEGPPARGRRGTKKKDTKKKPPEIDKALLRKYKTALDSALKIATCYNVKPISGSTLILCNVGSSMSRNCTAARGLGKPRTVLEVGVLLGLMCKYACENSTMLIYGHHNTYAEVLLEEGTILHNMEKVKEAALGKNLTHNDGEIPIDFLTKLVVDRKHVDNIVLLTDAMKLDDQQGREAMDFLKKYRLFVNPELLFVSVDLSGSNSGVSSTITPEHPNDIYLAGYSDQILRFIAECGDSGQLTYVENIDKAFNLTGIKLPSLAESASMDEASLLLSLSSEKTILSTAQGQRWRTVRVFISSTFRDMHGERDLLTRFVFPELRARAHSRQIHVYEVDLRWGVTEQDARSHKALEICLGEIARSQYFIGLLGQRYGWIQDEYQVPDAPEFDWLKDFPTGKSITEVEMHRAALCDTDKAVGKAFFYFRDPSFITKVPQRYRAEFESESKEAFDKIESLKSDIFTSGLEVCDKYPCVWLGEVQNKPMVGGLESFGQRVLHNLWNAIQRDYPEDVMDEDAITQAAAQHNAFGESRASSFIGRQALLKKAREELDIPENKLVVVTGKAGCGKSAFMAAIAQEYAANTAQDLIIAHFTGAAPGSTNIFLILTRLCHELKRRFEVSRDVPEDYTDLVREWQSFLEESVTNLGKLKSKIVIMIDGVDLLEDRHNGRSLDWIPNDIPDGVVVLVSGVEGGMGVTNLRKRKPPPSEIVVGPLDIFDKVVMVRKKLLKHRKTLDESPFNNQMKLLLTKKEAINPLYLHLACEELRVFGVFEEVTTYLKKMPTTISNLLQDILQRLETEHTTETLSTALIFLTLVRNGLLEYELTQVLQLGLKELYPEKEESLSPMVVSKLLRSLQTFLQPTGQETEGRLTLAHKDIERAVKLRYTRGAASKKEGQLHLLLATFFRTEADPHGNGTFKGNSARAFVELPYHLVEAGAWKELEELLCNINFVIAKCQLGLAHQLLEDYTPASLGVSSGKSREVAKFVQQPTVQEYKHFVSRNLHVLVKAPALALQQALNEPTSSAVATASKDIQQDNVNSMMIWVNKPEIVNPCQMNIPCSTGVILCVAVSPDSSFFAAGFKNGAVKVYEVATGKEVNTFIGHASGITSVCFVGSHSVCSASRDTTLSLWDTMKGIRTAILKGHSRGVHGCAADQAGKNVVSVSWDTSIKVWEGRSGKLLSTLKTQGQHNTPINCVSFHPEGQLVVVGSWDTTLRIWDTFNQKRLKVLKGHKSSIQACRYAPTGQHIVSASLDGEVKIWSTRSGTAVGTIVGHCMPVNDITFTPNGQFLATACSDKSVKVWSGSLGQPIASIGSADLGFVHQVVFDHVTQSVSVGYHDGHIRQFNIQSAAEILAVKPHSAPVVGLAHHGNLHMAAFADGTIKVCELTSLQKSISLKGHTSPITCAVWEKNGFASASEDFCIIMWPRRLNVYTKMLGSQGKPTQAVKKRKGKAKTDPKQSGGSEKELEVKPLTTFKSEHTAKITAIAFSCDGLMMAAVSRDMSISIWSCIRQQQLKVLQSCHKDWITTCTFSDTSANILITGSTDFTLKVWEVDSGREKTTFKGHTSAINCVSMSQGCVVSSAFDGSVKMWTHKGIEITTMHCHKKRVNTCLLHIPSKAKANQLILSWGDVEDEDSQKAKVDLDEIFVLTGSDDGTVGVWKPFLPNEITSLVGHSDRVLSVTSTLNNQLLTSSTDGSIRMWNPPLPSTPLGDLTSRGTAMGHTGPVTSISALSIGQDAAFAVSGGRDGHVMIWEMTSERLTKLHQVKNSTVAVSAVSITAVQSSSQSGTFTAGSDDGEINYYKFDKRLLSQPTHTRGAATLMGPHPISKLVLSNDNKKVIAGSWSSQVTAIDSTKETAAPVPLCQHKGWVMDLVIRGQDVYSIGLHNVLYRCSISNSGSASTINEYRLHLTEQGEEEGLTLPLSLCAIQGTKYLAISDNKGKVSLWNTASLKVDLSKKLHGQRVNVVCGVSDSCFMTGSDDSTVKLWRVQGEGRDARVTQLGQFYSQACVTAISNVRGERKNRKPLFVVGDSLGHVTLLQWQH